MNDGVIIITVDGRTDRLIHGIANPSSSGVIFAIETRGLFVQISSIYEINLVLTPWVELVRPIYKKQNDAPK